jgi:hypothetical protein
MRNCCSIGVLIAIWRIPNYRHHSHQIKALQKKKKTKQLDLVMGIWLERETAPNK